MPISTAQVYINALIILVFNENMFGLFKRFVLHYFFMKGEELRKQIGSPAYIECSSKTQQVKNSLRILHNFNLKSAKPFFFIFLMECVTAECEGSL